MTAVQAKPQFASCGVHRDAIPATSESRIRYAANLPAQVLGLPGGRSSQDRLPSLSIHRWRHWAANHRSAMSCRHLHVGPNSRNTQRCRSLDSGTLGNSGRKIRVRKQHTNGLPPGTTGDRKSDTQPLGRHLHRSAICGTRHRSWGGSPYRCKRFRSCSS